MVWRVCLRSSISHLKISSSPARSSLLAALLLAGAFLPLLAPLFFFLLPGILACAYLCSELPRRTPCKNTRKHHGVPAAGCMMKSGSNVSCESLYCKNDSLRLQKRYQSCFNHQLYDALFLRQQRQPVRATTVDRRVSPS